MFSIIAFLSDIPYYIAALVEQITGSDASAITYLFSKGFAGIFELAEKLIGQI